MRAIAYGFGATILLGIISGLTIPFTNLTLPVLGYALVGVLGGLVAGYMVATGMADGAINGLVATMLGAIIVAIGLVVFNVLFTGVFFGLTTLAASIVVIALAGIPGVVGGALGSMLHDRSEARRSRPVA
ncbi:DUF5518 domain-containing protein [Haloferax sp. DFSO60]|uniref:DUF5518 domain-containing protein n=1 Tax=Haloferax sp. DFSO60 TaxID=3388652 RepID=UPI0039795E5E